MHRAFCYMVSGITLLLYCRHHHQGWNERQQMVDIDIFAVTQPLHCLPIRLCFCVGVGGKELLRLFLTNTVFHSLRVSNLLCLSSPPPTRDIIVHKRILFAKVHRFTVCLTAWFTEQWSSFFLQNKTILFLWFTVTHLFVLAEHIEKAIPLITSTRGGNH